MEQKKKEAVPTEQLPKEAETPQNQDDMSASSESQKDTEDRSDDESENGAEASDWLNALAAAAPGDAFYEEEEAQLPFARRQNQDEDELLDENDVDYYLKRETPPEQCFEEVWTELPPLPKENGPYPQEDPAYFASKTEPNYVRNDKITLNEIVSIAKTLKEHSLPSMRSVYQDKVDVERKGW